MVILSEKKVADFRAMIWTFYEKNKRSFPWRETTEPYRIVVSEIMLQQTQTHRVVKKYEEFVRELASFEALAGASLQEVLALWQGLGYNRRAKSLNALAEIVVAQKKGQLPKNVDELDELPGIGYATACSIAAFAFNSPVAFIETNIRRVFINEFFAGKIKVNDDEILPLVAQTLDTTNPREWYYALMDFGAHLKTQVINPNRRSAHYTKQSEFDGSDRQIRGMILKELVARETTQSDLLLRIGKGKRRVEKILKELDAEGFITCRGTKIRIA